jgi:hypothetical protein
MLALQVLTVKHCSCRNGIYGLQLLQLKKTEAEVPGFTFITATFRYVYKMRSQHIRYVTARSSKA